MRHIAIQTFTPSAEWQQLATDANTELQSKQTLSEKLAYIKGHSEVWKGLGRELIQHFGNKCWYTDAANYGSRLDVEHFRPKSKTVELKEADFPEASSQLLLKLNNPSREGYWWLAFHADNLLLCAQVMNREAKRNFFPLHRDSPVATEATPNDWRNEIAVFLDPRKLADVCLVAYDETGGMRPVAGLSEWDRIRVVITNQCFGLSRFQPLIEGRQRAWQACSQLIERYVKAATTQNREGTPNPILEKEKDDALLSIHRLLDPDEAFSSVVASCLQNSPYQWARALASMPPARRARPAAQNQG